MVIDLMFLNPFIRRKSFHMETIWSIAVILRQEDYMGTQDLKEAYLNFPVF